MSPPESERSRRLPTLTWESIVDRDPSADEGRESGAPAPAPPTPVVAAQERSDPRGTQVPPPPPAPFGRSPQGDAGVESAPAEEFGHVSLSLHLGDVAPAVSGPAPSTSQPSSAEPPEEFHLTLGSLTLDGDVDDLAGTASPDSEADPEAALPMIREATPVEPYIVDTGSAQAAPTTTVPAIISGATPLLPGAQPSPIVLPLATQPDQSSTRPPAISPLAVEIPQRRPAGKRRGRSGLQLVVVFAVLAAVVGAAIVIGRPYLFPDDWAANAKPYANAVVQVTGAEFAEPVTVTAEPAAAYQPRVTAQTSGDWSTKLPVWRALGLAGGEITDAKLAELLSGWEPALYSTTDGQIYHDDALTGPALDAALTLAVATAWLDQEFGWATGHDERTLDGAALTRAEVLAQATAILQGGEYKTEVTAAPTGPLAYLPAVISYEALAPAMYAPLLVPVGADSANPLDTASVDAETGPLAEDVLELAGAATLADGDVIVGSPAPMDRSFWYLVLAGYLDAPTAYGASESIVESALTITERAGTTCAYATFSGGDLIQTQTLRAAMESWVGRAGAEMTSAFSVGDDGGLQMQSCDPGAQAAPTARLGVVRELIGWRSAELATVSGVIAAGGGDAEIGAALDRLAASDVGAQLASSPVDQSPADAAAEAKAAVEPIVTPPAPAEPAG